ncbi:MAG: hypothetical protein Q7S23_06005 [bacterium]|nr:hypothetical protein [bacterium]
MYLAVTEESLASEPWSAFVGLAVCIAVLLFIETIRYLCRRCLRRLS